MLCFCPFSGSENQIGNLIFEPKSRNRRTKISTRNPSLESWVVISYKDCHIIHKPTKGLLIRIDIGIKKGVKSFQYLKTHTVHQPSICWVWCFLRVFCPKRLNGIKPYRTTGGEKPSPNHHLSEDPRNKPSAAGFRRQSWEILKRKSNIKHPPALNAPGDDFLLAFYFKDLPGGS